MLSSETRKEVKNGQQIYNDKRFKLVVWLKPCFEKYKYFHPGKADYGIDWPFGLRKIDLFKNSEQNE